MGLQLVDRNFKEIKIASKAIPPGCKITIPKIYVSALAMAKMHALAQLTLKNVGKLEVFGYFLGEEMGKALDVVVPHVEVTGAYGEVTPENIRSVMPEIKEINEKRMKKNEERKKKNEEIKIKNDEIRAENEKTRELNNARKEEGLGPLPEKEEIPLLRDLKPLMLVGWTHSHVRMPVFSSNTDNEQHEILHRELRLSKLMDQVYDQEIPRMFYVIGVTVNVYGEQYGVIKGSLVCGLELQQFEHAEIELLETNEYTEDEIKEHLKLLKDEIPRKIHLLSDRVTPKRDRFIEPVVHRRERKPTSLEKYLESAGIKIESRQTTDPSSSIMDEIKDTVTIEKIESDESIKTYMEQLQHAFKKKPKTLVLIEKIYKNIISRSRDVMLETINEIMTKLETTEEDNIIYPGEEGSDDDECSKCGEALTNENYEGDIINGEPVCTECKDNYCRECGVEITEENFHDDGTDHVPICNDCFEMLQDEEEEEPRASMEQESDDEDDSEFNYFDEEGTPIKCIKCEGKIVLGENFEGEVDDDGMPLCTTCSSGEPEHVQANTSMQRARDDPEYIS